MKKLLLLVAILITGCTKYPVIPQLESTAKMNEAASVQVVYNCSNAETGITDVLMVASGKIYIGSKGAWFRELQDVNMADGNPLIRYQADYAVWYTKPNPILTSMNDKSYRLACVKRPTV